MIKQVRSAIQTAIQTAAGSSVPVYFGNAIDGTSGLYVVWNYDIFNKTDGKTTGQIEINAIGNGLDTTTVEDLADDIAAAFDHSGIMNNLFYLHTYTAQRSVISEEDRRIIRRRLVVEFNLFER